MSNSMEIQRFPTPEAMQDAAAALVLEAARQAVAERGRCILALSGGRTPVGLYARLSAPPILAAMPWDRCHFFMADERLVPLDHEHSNFGQANRLLLSRVPVPAANLHPMPVDRPTPAQAARVHAEELSAFFGGPPVFDLVLLGLGPDGHTASLFPDRLALDAMGPVAGEPEPGLPPRTPRLTLTFEALNRARTVLFCATGSEKTALVDRISADPEEAAEDIPAARVRPAGRLLWFLAP